VFSVRGRWQGCGSKNGQKEGAKVSARVGLLRLAGWEVVFPFFY
jgi:hypothetical protein